VFLLWVGYEVIKQSGLNASAPVLITMGLGIPLVIIAKIFTKGDFFKQPLVAYTEIDE
jgi:hypothetical protein